MIYFEFNELPVGTVKDLVVPFGHLLFCKCSSTMWLVELSLKNEEPFVYTRFTQSLTEIEAATLYEKYEEKC